MDILAHPPVPPTEAVPTCPALAEFGIHCHHAHPFDPSRWCGRCAEEADFEEWVEANDPGLGDGEWADEWASEWEGGVE